MQNPSIAVEAQQVSKVFGQGKTAFTALDKVNVAIRENEFFTLLGPSGCGKTTLLRVFAGFEHPTEGAILLNGKDIAHLPPHQRPINTVFQNYALFPHMTVAGNIAFGLEMQGKPAKEINETVDRMLDLVQMKPMRDRLTSQISGGQQQRVALARALAPAPGVLLLDEPLSALDYKLRKEMQIELKRLQHETGITFIFVTHDQEEALTMSDRIAVISQGKILQIGSPHDIYERPAKRFVADFIGETNFIEGVVDSISDTTVSVRTDDGSFLQVKPDDSQTATGQRITLAIRPEHTRLVEAGTTGTLSGVLENVVYFGTDTHFHVRLNSGENFTVRQQNSQHHDQPVHKKTGDAVGVYFTADTARILKD